MAMEPREQGPTARRVAANVKDIRSARGLSLQHLAERLSELGQPISANGLSKVELGDRRVDVDDLVALAMALGVAPNRLLLTATADEEPLGLTPAAEVTERAAWQWAAGDEELRVTRAAAERPAEPLTNARLAARRNFRDANRPHIGRDEMTLSQITEHLPVLKPIFDAALVASAAGVTWPTIREFLEMSQGLTHRIESAMGDDDAEH